MGVGSNSGQASVETIGLVVLIGLVMGLVGPFAVGGLSAVPHGMSLLRRVTPAAPVAPADGPAPRERALGYLALPAATFAAAADVVRPAPFDWSSDGCSPPTPAAWGRRFAAACRLHDFGYRNFGHGLALEPTEPARARIDRRFLEEMRRTCATVPAILVALHCRRNALAMYVAVRRFGRRRFYGLGVLNTRPETI